MSQRSQQFIQMLKILSDISQGNEDIRLRGEQIALSKKQIAQQLKESHNKAFADAMSALTEAAPVVRKARNAVYQAGDEFSPQEKSALEMVMSGAPISAAVQSLLDADAGVKAQQGTPAELMRQRNAAFLRSTGLNEGQISQAAINAAALGGGDPNAMRTMYGNDVANYMQYSNALKQLTGQTAFAFDTEHAATKAGYAPLYAQQQFQGVEMGKNTPIPGARVPASVALQYDIGKGGVEASFGRNSVDAMAAAAQGAAQLANALGKQGVSIDDKRQILASMSAPLDKMQNSRATPQEREMAIGLWNAQAYLGGFTELIIDDPKKATEKMHLWQRLLGSPAQSIFQRQGPTGLGQPQNPMSYFVPPAAGAGATTMPPQGFNVFPAPATRPPTP